MQISNVWVWFSHAAVLFVSEFAANIAKRFALSMLLISPVLHFRPAWILAAWLYPFCCNTRRLRDNRILCFSSSEKYFFSSQASFSIGLFFISYCFCYPQTSKIVVVVLTSAYPNLYTYIHFWNFKSKQTFCVFVVVDTAFSLNLFSQLLSVSRSLFIS